MEIVRAIELQFSYILVKVTLSYICDGYIAGHLAKMMSYIANKNWENVFTNEPYWLCATLSRTILLQTAGSAQP